MAKQKNKETRTATIERKDNESRTVTGYAAVFNAESENLGGFVEIIERGAFTEALQNSDVRALFNHDDNQVLARNTSGTLILAEDEHGLRYEFEAPQTSYGNDLLEMLKRGDISQSSFGFTIAPDGDELERRDNLLPLRRIKKVQRLFDVSPVTYPAYPDTTVMKRRITEAIETPKDNTNEIDLRLLDGFLKAYSGL